MRSCPSHRGLSGARLSRPPVLGALGASQGSSLHLLPGQYLRVCGHKSQMTGDCLGEETLMLCKCPVFPQSVAKSCAVPAWIFLQQFRLRSSSGAFPSPALLVCLLIGILSGTFAPSSLFIYSVIYLYPCGLMDMCFVLWVIVWCWCYCGRNLCSDSPGFGRLKLRLGLVFLRSFNFFSFLLFSPSFLKDALGCPCVVPPQLWNQPPLQREMAFLLLENHVRNQDLGAPGLTALGCPCFLAFSALSIFFKAQTLHSAQTKASHSWPCQPRSSPPSRPLHLSPVLSSHMGLLSVLQELGSLFLPRGLCTCSPLPGVPFPPLLSTADPDLAWGPI